MLNKVVETRSKYTDTAVTCLLDFARGAIRAQDGEPLMYAVDIAHELKVCYQFNSLRHHFIPSFPEVPDDVPEPETILGIGRRN